MEHEYPCIKKDKRLLVLLALGGLILLADMRVPLGAAARHDHRLWVELQGKDHTLLRVNSEEGVKRSISGIYSGNIDFGISAGKKGRQSRVFTRKMGDEQEPLSIAAVSPRIAFFLGVPFSLNNADTTDLERIPGIGPALAEKIISYRNIHGPFTTSDQLENISGIGPRMRERLLTYCVIVNDE